MTELDTTTIGDPTKAPPSVLWATAFVGAAADITTVAKSASANIPTKSGSYSYSYAELGDVMAVIRPVFAEWGLAMSQAPVADDGRVGVRTRVWHEKGHVEDFGVLLLPAGTDARSAGSAITYARRYAAASVVGLVAQDDLDGAGADTPPPRRSESPTPPNRDETSSRSPEPEGDKWLRRQIEVFDQWSAHRRRVAWTDAAREGNYPRPLSLEDAKSVFDLMEDAYCEEFEQKDMSEETTT